MTEQCYAGGERKRRDRKWERGSVMSAAALKVQVTVEVGEERRENRVFYGRVYC